MELSKLDEKQFSAIPYSPYKYVNSTALAQSRGILFVSALLKDQFCFILFVLLVL